MYIVSIDIGYSYLKSVSGHSNSKIEKFLIQHSTATPVSNLPLSIIENGPDSNIARVSIKDCDWATGFPPEIVSTFERELNSDYIFSDQYKALLQAGLKQVANSNIDVLVSGLPVSDYLTQPLCTESA